MIDGTNDQSRTKFCPGCGKGLHPTAQICPSCGAPQPGQVNPRSGPRKDRITAAVLALLLGGIGVHKFYLGNTGLGIVYLIFCFTFIPAIIAFIEGIILLCSSNENFDRKYN